MDSRKEFSDSVTEGRKKHAALEGSHGLFRHEIFGGSVEKEEAAGLFIGAGFSDEGPFFIIGGGHAVEGIAGFSVILQAPLIDVNHGDAEFGKGIAQHAVPLFIFPQSKGGGRKVEEKGNILLSQNGHGGKAVVFIPAIFAEKDTGANGFAAGRKEEGRQRLF